MSDAASAQGPDDVRFVGVRKTYGSFTAVHDLNLTIEKGEFFSLLGPSGCGKTTTLRMVAGFETPTEGSIYLAGVDVARVPAHKRRVNTVFQNYALFPFLSVQDNVAFGLRRKRTPKAEVGERVRRALEMVQMQDLALRKPSELSGGQQQRVAVARALVNLPTVLLLDEPLGALDAKLRKGMQLELKKLQSEVGITFIYVTHDQEEALTMSDRIAVMSQGVIEQVGTPGDVYERPSSAFVANFIGVSNIFQGEVETVSDGIATVAAPAGLRVRVVMDDERVGPGQHVGVVVRPESVRVYRPDQIDTARQRFDNVFEGRISSIVYTGASTQFVVESEANRPVQSIQQNTLDGDDSGWSEGQEAIIAFSSRSCSVIEGRDEGDKDLLGEVVRRDR
jgi:spermidine/putrescine transport system ATP-binding protein